MRKIIFITLSTLGLIFIIIRFGFEPVSSLFDFKQVGGIRIEANKESKVFLNNQEIGKTPLQLEDLEPDEYLIKLENEISSWQGYVKVVEGTLVVVNRDLGISKAKSSGEIINLELGSGVTVISTPNEAEVVVDGKFVGKTPIEISDLTKGEHIFIISHLNFLKRSIKVVLTEGYHLNLGVDLAISETDFTNIPTNPIQASIRGVVKQTPVGFLRLREKASLNSKEIGKINSGDEVIILEELSSWMKVKLKDDKEGFVSASYITKK